MNRKLAIISVLLLIVAITSPFLANTFFLNQPQKRPFYVGVEYAYADDAAQLKALIDKVANYTNLFVIGSIAVTFNRTALDESCQYIYDSGLSFIVLFTGIDRYNWSDGYRITDWMIDAQEKYGEKFLGIYKIDEPGGNQLDGGPSAIINDTTTYAQTSQSYVGNLSQMINYYHPYTPSVFTADYALSWFNYKANYTANFGEFVGNESRPRIIAQNRGAATAFHRTWGVIINWKYTQGPHYLETGEELYDDLALAYSAGAKYAIVFSYPNTTGTYYGILEDEHFEALQRFWNDLQSHPSSLGLNEPRVAYILPKDYGFGFRAENDRIWGLFPSDHFSAKIYDDIQTLIDRHGARFDILYDETETAKILPNYNQVFYWNQTIS